MKVLKALKFLVLVVSVSMFVYQCSTAVQNLQEKPVLDRTEYTPIQNITKPIITICPQQELNETILRSFRYESADTLLEGKNMRNENLFSWTGWNENITYINIVTSTLDFDIIEDLKIDLIDEKTLEPMDMEVKHVYYNVYGLCYEIEGN